jgi:hypothetical protein
MTHDAGYAALVGIDWADTKGEQLPREDHAHGPRPKHVAWQGGLPPAPPKASNASKRRSLYSIPPRTGHTKLAPSLPTTSLPPVSMATPHAPPVMPPSEVDDQ